MTLAMFTGIAPSVWADEDAQAIATAVDVIDELARAQHKATEGGDSA